MEGHMECDSCYELRVKKITEELRENAQEQMPQDCGTILIRLNDKPKDKGEE